MTEVLVTLGIIGVVATLTLPSMIAKHKEKELIVAWKKAFSDMSNAAMLMSQYTEDLSNEQRIAEAFAKYIKSDRVCEANKDIEQGCWNENTPVYTFKRQKICNSLGEVGGGAACINTVSGGSLCIDSGGRYSILLYDVNGTRKPNIVGDDIFAAIFDSQTYIVRVAQGYKLNWGAADGQFVIMTEGDGTCGSDRYGWACSAEKLVK